MLIDRYAESPGMRVALALVNDLVVAPSQPVPQALDELFAFDPESVADRPGRWGRQMTALAHRLHRIIDALNRGDVDVAASGLNEILAQAPAVPHLVPSGDGTWQLHHHPKGADFALAWRSLCAEALAILIGEGQADRVHLCAADDCGRAFVDTTKNGTRRFCSERCQNRVKATALRRRRAAQTQTKGT